MYLPIINHDALTRPVAKSIDGSIVEKYLWNGRTQLLAVLKPDNSIHQRFIYADDRLPYAMTQDNQIFYMAYDQVGSLRIITDSSGNVVKEIRYDTFGNIVSDSNPSFAVPFGFAGGLHDIDTGLVRFGYRDYAPEIGRWTAKDPIGFEGGDTNLYGYVFSDPVNFVDPEGLKTLRCSRALGNPDNPAKRPYGNPLRHDYLVIDGEVYSFQAGNNMFLSQGIIDDKEYPSNSLCQVISEDPKFDQAAKKAVKQVGARLYSIQAYLHLSFPFNIYGMLGIRNCQSWADDVLLQARVTYATGD